MTAEAIKSAERLSIEVEHVFTVPVSGIGEGSVKGETRSEIVSTREKTRAQLCPYTYHRRQDQHGRGVKGTSFFIPGFLPYQDQKLNLKM